MGEPCSRPRIVRRAAGVLLLLLGGLGVELCAAGVVGSWAVRQSLGESASRACERAERLLSVTAESLRPIRAGLEEARANLDAFHDVAKQPASAAPERRRARNLLRKKLAGEISQRFEGAQLALAGVTNTAVVLNTLLQHLDEIPLARMDRLDAGAVRDPSDRLTNLAESSRSLSQSLDKSPVEATEAAQPAAQMKENLAQVAAKVNELSARVAEVQARVGVVRSGLHTRFLTAAILGTVFLVWAGIGQVCLLAYGWSWFRAWRAP